MPRHRKMKSPGNAVSKINVYIKSASDEVLYEPEDVAQALVRIPRSTLQMFEMFEVFEMMRRSLHSQIFPARQLQRTKSDGLSTR